MKNPLIITIPMDGQEIVVHLRERGGIYHADWWHRGQHFNRSTKNRVLMQARIAAQVMVKKAAGSQLADARGNVILDTARADYLEERWPGAPAAHRTFMDYRSRLGIFQKFAGAEIDLAALDYDNAVGLVQRFFAHRMSLGDAPRSRIHFRTVLKQFFDWLITTRNADGRPMVLWRFNPASTMEIKVETPEEVLLPPLTDDELTTFLNAAKKPVPWGYDQPAQPRGIWRSVLLCYGAGARPKEASRLKFSEVDWKSGTLILHGKKRRRTIKMSTWLVSELKPIADARAPGAPDCTIVGASRSRTNKQMQKLQLTDELPAHFTLQALRRTAAVRAAPAMTVQQYSLYFGHSIEVAIKYYIGWGLLGQSEAMNVLAMPAKDSKADHHRENHRRGKGKTA